MRKTIDVIRRRPILLLPLLGVDQIALYLNVLRHILNRKIEYWLLTAHSVTGGRFDISTSDPYARARVLMLLGPLSWANYFVRMLLFTAAFMITACLIRNAIDGAPLAWRDALSVVWKRMARILLFTLKFFGAFAAAGVLSVAFYQLDRVIYWLTAAGQWAVGLWSIIAALLIAWLFATPALRLLNPTLAKPLPTDLKRSARLICILCAVASTILSVALQNLKFPPDVLSSFDPWFWQYPVPSLESALIALPYLPMWTGLALLAFTREPMIEIPSPS